MELLVTMYMKVEGLAPTFLSCLVGTLNYCHPSSRREGNCLLNSVKSNCLNVCALSFPPAGTCPHTSDCRNRCHSVFGRDAVSQI